MSLRFPFHFDGHGVNDKKGARIATINLPMHLNGTTDRNPHHTAAGNLLATAPLLLECLEGLMDCTDADVDDATREAAIEDARAAIAQAHSLQHCATWDESDPHYYADTKNPKVRKCKDCGKLKRTKG